MPVAGGVGLVMTMAGVMVIEKFWVALGRVPFAAVMVPVNKPAVVGVPEMTPPELSVSGGGKAPDVTENVIGALPVATQVWE